MLAPGFVIGSEESFSRHLEEQLAGMPRFMRARSGCEHWVRGIYIITEVEKDDGRVKVDLDDNEDLEHIRQMIDQDTLSVELRGEQYQLAAAGSLAGCPVVELAARLVELEAPATLVLESVAAAAGGAGDDHIAAVNLTREIAASLVPNAAAVERAVGAAVARYPGSAAVEVTHYIGGPCDEREIVTCMVLGGSGAGWTVIKDLEEAVVLAHARGARRTKAQGDFGGGQTVTLSGLKSASSLNGEVGLTLSFDTVAGRWLVRLRDGTGKKVKPTNLIGGEGAHGRVFVCWGDARWSRAQLLGEIARGSWGLGKASVADLTAAAADRRAGLDGRLVFAPVTDMSEDYYRDAREEMERATDMVRAAAVATAEARLGTELQEGDEDLVRLPAASTTDNSPQNHN